MRLILQLCLCILVLQGARTSSWGRMACHEPATTSQAFIRVSETDPDAPPMGVSSGDWFSHDATGFEDGPNVYAYVKENPWTSWDPHGLQEEKERPGSLKRVFGEVGTMFKELFTTPDKPQTAIGKFDQDVKKALDHIGVIDGPVTQARHEKSMREHPTATKAIDFFAWGVSQPGTPFGMVKPLPILNTPKILAQQKSGVLRTQGTRYVGEGEAAVIEKTKRVPNTTATGESKTVFYTHDKPHNSAAEAQAAYKLPEVPTHRVTVDTRSAKPGAAGNVEGGTGIELMTDRSLPTIKGTLKRLGE